MPRPLWSWRGWQACHARFVTGFAPGNWLPNERQWVITEAEAHSWPEVYFPEVGWVRFEPTAYRPQEPRIGLPDSSALAGVLCRLSRCRRRSRCAPGCHSGGRRWLALPLMAVAWGAVYLARAGARIRGLGCCGGAAGRPAHAGRRDHARVRQLLAAFVEEKHAAEGEATARRQGNSSR